MNDAIENRQEEKENRRVQAENGAEEIVDEWAEGFKGQDPLVFYGNWNNALHDLGTRIIEEYTPRQLGTLQWSDVRKHVERVMEASHAPVEMPREGEWRVWFRYMSRRSGEKQVFGS